MEVSFNYEKNINWWNCSRNFFFNPVECKYEIFHIVQDKEIYEYHVENYILAEQLKK